jgi:hypothetical protein
MAEMVFSWGVSELKCIIFTENNDYPYENYNNFLPITTPKSNLLLSTSERLSLLLFGS